MKYKLIITDKEGEIISEETYRFIDDLLLWTTNDKTKFRYMEDAEAEIIIDAANKLQTISEEK